MAIANVSLSDTFDNWRIRTNEVIITVNQNDTKLQSAYDTANISYVVANTGFDKANSANYYSYLVDGNTKAAFDTANIAIANVNYVNTFAQLLALDSNNATVLIAVPGYNKANAANYYSYLVDGNTQAAFLQSNTAYLVANTGYDKANSANYYAFLIDANSKASFAKGNAAHLTANTSYDKANSANIVASAAFDKANTAWTASNDGAGSGLDADLLDGQQGAYYLPTGSYTAADVLSKLLTVDGAGTGLDSDSPLSITQLAFGKANTACTSADTAQATGVAAFLKGNTAHLTANAAFATANAALPSSSYTASDVLSKLLTVDGTGSGLDSDLLDGQQGAYYQPASSAITTTNIGSQSVNYASSAGNADTVDGYHAASFALSSHTHAASAITSGTMATARLGSGTASSDTFLSGDQTYKMAIKSAAATRTGGDGTGGIQTLSVSVLSNGHLAIYYTTGTAAP
jgi:hypothetical protein